MPSIEVEIAWAAGLFEGEGWYTRQPNGDPIMAIRSTDRDVIEHFRDVMGYGNVRPVNKGARYKRQWHWQTSGYPAVERITGLFRPYLGARRLRQYERVMGTRLNQLRLFAAKEA